MDKENKNDLTSSLSRDEEPEMKRPNCKFCNTPMSIGKALVNKTKRSKDFADDLDYGVTISVDTTKAIMEKVWKCRICGYSKYVVIVRRCRDEKRNI